MAIHETDSDPTIEPGEPTHRSPPSEGASSPDDQRDQSLDDNAQSGGDPAERDSSIGPLTEELQEKIVGNNAGMDGAEGSSVEIGTPEQYEGGSRGSEEEATSLPNARERSLPQDDFLIYDRLTRESTLAQDTLGFDYVRGDGIIVDGHEYIGLVEVQPRNWLVLNDAERTAVFRAFMSFLLGLKYPIQILSVPHEFDIGTHTQKIRIADSLAKRNAESPIHRHGRRRQVAWMHNTIDRLSVKDRDFYVVTRVHSAHVNAISGVDRPLPGIPILGIVIGGLLRSASIVRTRRQRDIESRNEERSVKEVRARQNELSETLTKTGVSTRIVSDRDETMDILYHHYNHVKSPFSTYNHATYTKLLANALHRGRVE